MMQNSPKAALTIIPEIENMMVMKSQNFWMKYEMKEYLVKKSQWIFGGDGWAYDWIRRFRPCIGFGEDVNVLYSIPNCIQYGWSVL